MANKDEATIEEIVELDALDLIGGKMNNTAMERLHRKINSN